MWACQSSSGIYDSLFETSLFHEKNFKSKLLRTLSVKGKELLFTQSTICKRSNKSTTEVLECKINRAAMVRYCADNQLYLVLLVKSTYFQQKNYLLAFLSSDTCNTRPKIKYVSRL